MEYSPFFACAPQDWIPQLFNSFQMCEHDEKVSIMKNIACAQKKREEVDKIHGTRVPLFLRGPSIPSAGVQHPSAIEAL